MDTLSSMSGSCRATCEAIDRSRPFMTAVGTTSGHVEGTSDYGLVEVTPARHRRFRTGQRARQRAAPQARTWQRAHGRLAARWLVCWAPPGSDTRRVTGVGHPSLDPERPAAGERSGSTAVEERSDDPRRELRRGTSGDVRRNVG